MEEHKETIENQNSVKLSVNAKNQWSGEVKVYASTIENAMLLAKDKAEELADLIKEKNG